MFIRRLSDLMFHLQNQILDLHPSPDARSRSVAFCWPTRSCLSGSLSGHSGAVTSSGHFIQKYSSGNLIFGCVVWDTRGLAWTLQPAGMLVSYTCNQTPGDSGHPAKTCLPLWKNNGHILGWQRVRGAPIEEEVSLVAVNLLLNLKAIDPVCLFSLTRDVLLEDLSGTPLYGVNGQNWAPCMETTANHRL